LVIQNISSALTIDYNNTARAKNPAAENGKFFAEAPDIPDEKIAQYAILFEHPDQITSSEEHPGWYWLSHR